MSTKNILIEKKVTYNTIIEINDPSNDFIPYWNLAMKEHLNNNFITVGTESNKSGVKSLASFYIKLVDKKESFSPDKSDFIQLDKLFIIDVYRIKKEKEFKSDFITNYKNNHNTSNFNVILYNIDEIKENTIKNINKIHEKIKSKMGFSDFSFVPYNEQNYGKFYSIIDNFFISLKNKITTEYNNKVKYYEEKINKTTDIYNGEEEAIYEYIKDKILYIDLLTMGDFWDMIKKTCFVDAYKTFRKLNNKFIFENCESFADLEVLDIKKKVKNKTLTNVDYQIFILYNYIRSCRYLKEHISLSNFMCNFTIKMATYESYFKSIYHFLYWKINFVFNLINYLIFFKEKITQKDFDYKNSIEQGIIYLYTLLLKEFKNYGKKLKIEIPSVKIFIFLKNCVDKGLNIKEELEKIMAEGLEEIEKDEIYKQFKTDIKTISDREKYKKNVYDIFTNRKAFIEEYLLILQIINKRSCEFCRGKIKTSIRGTFEIIPLLLSLNRFEEAKKILNSLLEKKIFKNNKWSYSQEYVCLMFIMLLNCLEKNKENLNLMFKLLDTNFSKLNFFLKILESKEENLINQIINQYIESYSEIKDDNNEDKFDKSFSLDKALDIKLEKIKDNIIFINKSKTKKEQIKYKFTNNTGINVNIDRIQLIFEEFSSLEKDNNQNKIIVYEIDNNSNTFKTIMPFVKEQENTFNIIVGESNDIFKLNTIYKFKEIKYIIKNSLCGIYHIKEEMKISINSIDMKISTQVYPSYDSSDFENDIKYKYYFNVLSKININIVDIPSTEDLANKSVKFIFENINKKNDGTLIIQTHVLKENLIQKYPDVIIDDYSVEFPPNSLKDKEKLENIIIPFYVENINFYDSGGAITIKINANILDKNDNDKIVYSYVSFHDINLIHLFYMKKKYRLLNNNAYLLQTTFCLNIEKNNIKVYTHNSADYSFYINTSQAVNLVLSLNNNKDDIIKKLRQNFLEFSIDKLTRNKEIKVIKYRLCYPEKSIIEEIKELTEIPYHIKIDVDDTQHDIFKEINVNINIKKNNKKNVVLLTHICDSENWAVIGKSKLVQEWFNDEKENNNEKNFRLQLLPLVDGFLKLPEIEFMEYEIPNNKEENNDKIKIEGVKSDDDKERSFEETIIGKMNFDPIEYGTVIEGNQKVLRITPTTECSLKLNLT